jgi:hypothetical protein
MAFYRYRLIDETGADLGPFVSGRLSFEQGEEIVRDDRGRFIVVTVVEPERREGFRAYLVVRTA